MIHARFEACADCVRRVKEKKPDEDFRYCYPCSVDQDFARAVEDAVRVMTYSEREAVVKISALLLGLRK